jgi:hypothetical protein
MCRKAVLSVHLCHFFFLVQEQWKLQGLNKLLLKMSGTLVSNKVTLRHMMCSVTHLPTYRFFSVQILRHYGIAYVQEQV